MKLQIFASTALTTVLVSAKSHFARQSNGTNDWVAAGPDDFRGPCPMMNTLANHGFLPHDGKNLTLDNVVNGLHNGLNFNKSLATVMWNAAIPINKEPNATYFTLDMLNVHNDLEHDASISRSDAYFGNNHVFNQTVFDTTKAFWTADLITVDMIANGKVFRQVVSRSTNPTYTFTATMQQFSIGEMAAPIVAFGDKEAVTANRTLLEYFFENERLPVELGWAKPTEEVTLADITRINTVIGNSTQLLTYTTPVIASREVNSHWGF